MHPRKFLLPLLLRLSHVTNRGYWSSFLGDRTALLSRPGSDKRDVLDVDLGESWEGTEDRFVFKDGVLDEAEGADDDEDDEDDAGARILLMAAGRHAAADSTDWPCERMCSSSEAL